MEITGVAGRWLAVLIAAGICYCFWRLVATLAVGSRIIARHAALSGSGACALMEAGDNAGAIKLLDQVIAYNGGEISDLTRRATAYAALHRK